MPGLVELVELAEEVVEYLRAQRVETSHQPILLILDGNLEIGAHVGAISFICLFKAFD